MNPDTRNLIAAICLSMSVLIGYQMLFGEPQKQIENKAQETIIEKNNEPSINLPQGNEDNNLVGKTKNIKSISRINITNKEVRGSISLLGARIDDLTLINYKKTLDEDSEKIRFLKRIDEKDPFFIQFGWSSPNGDKVPNGNSVWKSSNKILEPNNTITLEWNNDNGLIFYQIISIDENFMIKVDQKVKNNTNNSVNLYPYGLIRRSGEPETIDFFVLHEGPLGVFDGSLKEKVILMLRKVGKKVFL